jgi:hypothetical protein
MPNCPDCGQALTAVGGSDVWYYCSNADCLVKRVRFDKSESGVQIPKAVQINRQTPGMPKVNEF